MLGVDAGKGVVADFPAVACADEVALFGAAAAIDQETLRVFGVFGDDVDDAVDGVGAPERAGRAADDLDAVDVLHEGILHIPEDAGVEGGVDAAAIHEDQEFVGGAAVEATGGDGPGAVVDLGDFEAGGHTQSLGDAGCAGAANVILGDHRDGGGRLADGALAAGNGGDFDVHELDVHELVEGHLFVGRWGFWGG